MQRLEFTEVLQRITHDRGGANVGGGLGNNCEVRRMTRAERNEKLHQEAIARQLGRRYGKLTVIAYDNVRPRFIIHNS